MCLNFENLMTFARVRSVLQHLKVYIGKKNNYSYTTWRLVTSIRQASLINRIQHRKLEMSVKFITCRELE